MPRYPSLMAISVCAVLSAGLPALSQDAPQVLTGAAAFGDWSKDAPGVTRHFTVNDLPQPGATQSASNSPKGTAMPEGAMPKVPDGFKVELVAQGIQNPRAIRFAPNGDLFVANSQANEVRIYRIAEGQAKPTEEGVFATDKLNQPYGIAFYPPGDNPEWVYVANADGLVRFPYKSGDLKASGAPEVILEGIPPNHHWTRDVAFSQDGKTMYFSVGSGSNVAEGMTPEPEGGLDAWIAGKALGATWGSEERRADVLAFDPDGKNERVFATGLRNCSGLTVQPATDALWCVVNERDALGDNLPFDYATSVKEGAFYGWPWYYIGDHEDPRLAGKRPDLAGKVTVPDVLISAHSAPLNIAFYEGSQFPADYKGSAFIALHGSWNRLPRGGYKVVRALFDADGKPTGEYQDFMTGFVVSDDQVWGRPVGVAVSPDGSLFVSEDGNGTIWRVSYGG